MSMSWRQLFKDLSNRASEAELKMIERHRSLVEQIYAGRNNDSTHSHSGLDSSIETLMYVPADLDGLLARFDEDRSTMPADVKSGAFFDLYKKYEELVNILQLLKTRYKKESKAWEELMAMQREPGQKVLNKSIDDVDGMRELNRVTALVLAKQQELLALQEKYQAMKKPIEQHEAQTKGFADFVKKLNTYRLGTKPAPLVMSIEQAVELLTICQISPIRSIADVDDGFEKSVAILQSVARDHLKFDADQIANMFVLMSSDTGSSYTCKVTVGDVCAYAKDSDPQKARKQAAFNALLKMENHATYFRYFFIPEDKQDDSKIGQEKKGDATNRLVNFLTQFSASRMVTATELEGVYSCTGTKDDPYSLQYLFEGQQISANDPFIPYSSGSKIRDCAANEVDKYLRNAVRILDFKSARQLRLKYEEAIEKLPEVVQKKYTEATKALAKVSSMSVTDNLEVALLHIRKLTNAVTTTEKAIPLASEAARKWQQAKKIIQESLAKDEELKSQIAKPDAAQTAVVPSPLTVSDSINAPQRLFAVVSAVPSEQPDIQPSQQPVRSTSPTPSGGATE